MLIKLHTATLNGVEGLPVRVETDLHRGLPEFQVVGLADTTIREACKRIKPAIINSGYDFPNERLTVNLVPASRPKEGSHFDLPIAMSIILLMEGLDAPADTAMLGEVSLDGHLNPVRGVLPLAASLRREGIRHIILPRENAMEAGLLQDICVYPAAALQEVVDHIKGSRPIAAYHGSDAPACGHNPLDFSQVLGQESAKRAMLIGAAGNHGMLLVGSPGCGKTMIARRLPGILPALSYEEKLEIMGIYSVAGMLPSEHPIIEERPFRSPHHSISLTGLVGGGVKPRPGELSLAHRGVLFLDELGEFDSRVIDGLRQPIEDGFIRINRRQEEVIFPSRVMLLAAANPCKCGNLWDEQKLCTCTPRQLSAHRRKLMGPLADRIDMHVRMMPVERSLLETASSGAASGMTTAAMRVMVERARAIQAARYEQEQYQCNGLLDEAGIHKYCSLNADCRSMMAQAYEKLGLSMRGYHRMQKVARTIADLEGAPEITEAHIAEALCYRSIAEGGAAA